MVWTGLIAARPHSCAVGHGLLGQAFVVQTQAAAAANC